MVGRIMLGGVIAWTALASMAAGQAGPGLASNVEIAGPASIFAPGIASTNFSEVRLTLSPDGRTAMWFSRNRPGGPGGYDIWISRLVSGAWSVAEPAPFNSPTRDFDPAFSPDGKYVYSAPTVPVRSEATTFTGLGSAARALDRRSISAPR